MIKKNKTKQKQNMKKMKPEFPFFMFRLKLRSFSVTGTKKGNVTSSGKNGSPKFIILNDNWPMKPKEVI